MQHYTLFIFQDVDGNYRGLDKNIEKATNFTNYTTFSFWDTYRAFHPLLNSDKSTATSQHRQFNVGTL